MLASGGARHALPSGVDEVLCGADTLVIDGLGEGRDTSSTSISINASSTVGSAGTTISYAISRNSEIGLGGASADAVSSGRGKSHTHGAVGR